MNEGPVTRCEISSDRRHKGRGFFDKGIELFSGNDECEKEVDTLLSNLTEDEVKQLYTCSIKLGD
jgi:hypothetical protein